LERSIVIHITENIDSMQFNLSDDQKHFIYRCGVTAVKEQIDSILGITVQKEMKETLEQIASTVPDPKANFEILNEVTNKSD